MRAFHAPNLTQLLAMNHHENQSSPLPIIENVVGAPLRNAFLMSPGCGGHGQDYYVIFGHEVRNRRHGQAAGRKNRIAEGRKAMGIDWMTRAELSEAIPPAYSEYLGRQIINAT